MFAKGRRSIVGAKALPGKEKLVRKTTALELGAEGGLSGFEQWADVGVVGGNLCVVRGHFTDGPLVTDKSLAVTDNTRAEK